MINMPLYISASVSQNNGMPVAVDWNHLMAMTKQSNHLSRCKLGHQELEVYCSTRLKQRAADWQTMITDGFKGRGVVSLKHSTGLLSPNQWQLFVIRDTIANEVHRLIPDPISLRKVEQIVVYLKV